MILERILAGCRPVDGRHLIFIGLFGDFLISFWFPYFSFFDFCLLFDSRFGRLFLQLNELIQFWVDSWILL